MLLNLELSNWACFRDTVSFTMEAGPERERANHIAKIGAKSRPIKVLPMAAIYGNNASGKTQFVDALKFIRGLVLGELSGASCIPVRPFLLDEKCAALPTRFAIQFIACDVVYELEVVLCESRIEKECLSRFNTRTTAKTMIYERVGEKVSKCEWGSDAFCKYVATMSVDPKRLFLTMSSMMVPNDDQIKSVFGWFAHSLVVIKPDVHYLGMEDYCATGEVAERTQSYLARFDTGISRLVPKEVPLAMFDPLFLEDVRKNLKPNVCVRRAMRNDIYIFSLDKAGQLSAKCLHAVHSTQSGGECPFPISLESDGTRRMLDLIPAIASASMPANESVFIIDEIDRSLHHLVTRALVEDFLSACTADSRSQLIFTTHDLLLMDRDVCRRDEMWVTDKDPAGCSSLSDFSSFIGLSKVKKLWDVYLDGRLGGIPRSI